MWRRSSHSSSSGTSTAAALDPGFEMMPTVLMSGIQQEFPVPFRPQDGAIDDSRDKTQLVYGGFDTLAGGPVQDRVADDAAFADLTLADFELRLDQYNHFPQAAQQRRDRRQDQGNGDEADIADGKIYAFAEIGRAQVARIDALM